MSQNNVYNFIPSAEEANKKAYANDNGSSGNKAVTPKEEDSDTPNAQDTTGLNVTTDAQTKAAARAGPKPRRSVTLRFFLRRRAASGQACAVAASAKPLRTWSAPRHFPSRKMGRIGSCAADQ